MKKQSIVLGALLVMTLGLQGMMPSVRSISHDLSAIATFFNFYALSKEPMWAQTTNE